MDKVVRANVAEAILRCHLEDISIHEVLVYDEDGHHVVAVETDRSRAQDVASNFAYVGYIGAECIDLDDDKARVYIDVNSSRNRRVRCAYEENGQIVENDEVERSAVENWFKDSYLHHTGMTPCETDVMNFCRCIPIWHGGIGIVREWRVL